MPLRDALVPMCERRVQLHHVVAVTRDIHDAGGCLASFEESRKRHPGELALRRLLREAAPHRGTLRGVLAERQRMEQPESRGIGELTERLRGALVLLVLAANEQARVAGE